MEKKSYTHLASFVDLLLDAVCVVDANGRFVFVSAASERIFGYTPEEMIGRLMIEMVAPDDRERTLRAAQEIMSGSPKPHFENRYVRKDGQIVHIMWSARWSEGDQLRVAVARDVTQLKRAESMQVALYAISEAAHASEDLLALFRRIHQIIGTLLPAQNFSVAMYDERTNQLSFPYHVDEFDSSPVSRKPAAGTLCADVIRSGESLLLPDPRIAFPYDLQEAGTRAPQSWLGVPLTSQRGTIGVLVLKSYEGSILYTEADKELLQFVSTQVATAIERTQLHARMHYMAQHDDLTNLPNRGLLYDRLETALARTQRDKARMALLYLDLDKFKLINDSFGHAVGDQLLQEVASRLKQCVRASDTIARIGGDEFVVLLENIQSIDQASMVAEKISSFLGEPLTIEGHRLRIRSSIGIAIYPEHGADAQQLLKYADEAMYLSKKYVLPEDSPPANTADNRGSRPSAR